jgi:hypothetical protein
MRKSGLQMLVRRIPAGFVGVGFLAALWPFTRLDFDRHHDGYMLSVAIAHHGGLDLHREVATRYGPLTTWTQELFLHLPVAPAFALRIWTVLLLAGTAAIIADLGRVAPTRWHLNVWASSGAAVMWALMCDRWLGITLHPWSSVLAAFLTAVAMHCWVHAEARVESGHPVHAHWLFVGSGVAIGLTPFARVNVGLAAVIGTLTIALLTHRLRATEGGDRRGQISVLRAYALGLCVGLLLPILRLGWTRSIGAYVEQSILTPLEWSGSSGWQPRAYLEGALERTLPLLAILAVAMFVVSRKSARTFSATRRGLFQPRTILVLVTMLATLAAGVTTVRWFAANIGTDGESDSLVQTFMNHEWGAFTTSFLDIGLIATTATAIGLAGYYTRALLQRRQLDGEIIAMMMAGALGLAGLTQVYPTHDSRHIWWGLPLGVLTIIWTVQRTGRSINRYVPAIPLTLILISSSVVGWTREQSVEREAHPVTVSSAGFKSDEFTAGWLIEDVKLLDRTIGHSFPAIFLNYDLDLPTVFGDVRHVDQWVVEPAPSLVTRLSSRPPIVVDHWDPDLISLAPVEKFMSGTDYLLSSRSTSRVVLLAPPCINGACIGIDPNDVCMEWGSCRPRSFRTDEITAIELPVAEYLDADAEIPVDVFVGGFSTDQGSGRWAVDQLAGNPVLVELPAPVRVNERWITGQRAVLRFSSGDSATPFSLELQFRTSADREVDVHVLTTAEQKTVTVVDSNTNVQVMLDANSVQEVVIRCESFEARFAPAPELPVCAELVGMTLRE